MLTINTETPVGRLVAEHPQLTRALERMGIDYCCGGRRPLAEAIAQKGLDADEVLRQLQDAMKPQDGACAQLWLERSMADLVEHIVASHHGYLRDEVPRLQALAEKVARVHGPNHAHLVQLKGVVDGFQMEIDSHMMKEERILFPAIRDCEARGAALPQGPGALLGPIHCMEHEHDTAGSALADMRRLTGDFVPPEEACGTWRALYQGLAELEADMHRHVHEENNILFERVRAAGW